MQMLIGDERMLKQVKLILLHSDVLGWRGKIIAV